MHTDVCAEGCLFLYKFLLHLEVKFEEKNVILKNVKLKRGYLQ